MLNRYHWKWFTWGKHPSMDDFVWAGNQIPLFQAFSQWVDKGFAQIGGESRLRSKNCSWRFWTKGTGKEIVCGLVRNSCDGHGRNFPLLLVGTGKLKDWQNNSQLLPYAFESIWMNLEYVASARFDTVNQLNESLQLIERPMPEWRAYQERRYDSGANMEPAAWNETIEGGKLLLKIACRQPENLPVSSQFCNRVVPTDQVPMAVFIGEVLTDIAVAVINKALMPDDFLWLWNLNPESPMLAKQLSVKG